MEVEMVSVKRSYVVRNVLEDGRKVEAQVTQEWDPIKEKDIWDVLEVIIEGVADSKMEVDDDTLIDIIIEALAGEEVKNWS